MSDEAGDRSFYRVGGVSALVLGLGYLITIPLFAWAGAPPSSADALLRYLEGKTTVWWIIVALSVLTDLLYIPVAMSLYVALRQVNRFAILVSTTLVGLFIVLDLAVTWTSYASLIVLSGTYAGATSEAQRAATVAAAQYPAAVLASHLQPVYSIVILSSAILITGVLMLRSAFDRATAYVGLAVGGTGLVAITAWNVAVIANALLATAWVFLVGYRLLRIARR